MINTYKQTIRKLFNELRKYNPEVSGLNVSSVNLVGSYGTEHFNPDTSDIDFQIVTDNELPSWADVNSILDFINDGLIEKYGECSKGGYVEVVAINNSFLDGELFVDYHADSRI